jgi:hypothetical protein
MVSNFQVQFGQDTAGSTTLQTVPVYYGDPSRQASTILKQNSENTLNAVPAMAAYISSLTYDRDRLQNPYFESTTLIREQAFNSATQTYSGTQDNLYSVDRFMPAPYKLQMKLDIWTSNTDQKHQLIEQLVPLFNPGFEIQSTDNYLDWTSLSIALLTDVTYSSRSVPMSGDDNAIDIATLTFELPIWITLPAKVKKGGVVTQIIANIYNSEGDLNPDIVSQVQTTQIRYTPLNYVVTYTSNIITLYSNVTESGEGTPVPWAPLVQLYGTLVNGISQIRLSFEYPDGEHEIVGTVAYNPSNNTQLLFTPDPATLPANTLSAVTAIIDPQNVNVTNTDGNGNSLIAPVTGTRYLILNPIGSYTSDSSVAWAGNAGTNLVAAANDIIEYNGSYWTVSFDSANNPGIEYVTNLNTLNQYVWNNGSWTKSVSGVYRGGNWSLVL